MMRPRRVISAAAAILGAAALVAAPLASRAPASALSLPVYTMTGIARGVEFQFTPKPSTLDPLVDVGLLYTRSNVDSAGGGGARALASDVFPGDVVIGGAGCGGVPGTMLVSYPPTHCQKSSNTDSGVVFPGDGAGPLVLRAGAMQANVGLGVGHAQATGNHLTLNPTADLAIDVSQIRSTVDGLLTDAGAQQTSVVTTNGLRITTTSLTVNIPQMVARASSVSDGARALSDATLTIAGATATFGGETHSITIDNKGVHLAELKGPTPPPEAPLPEDVREPLGQRFQEALAQANIEIRSGNSVEITDGGNGEASVGGLFVSFRSGRPPAVPIPPVVTIPHIDNTCGPPSLPLCLGQGVVPFPPGDSLSSVAFGGADATSVAATFSIQPPCTTCSGGFGGGFTGGTTNLPPSLGGPGPTTALPGAVTQPVPAVRAPRTALVGLVAKMPSAALTGAGAFLLVLAVGLLAAPSLRS